MAATWRHVAIEIHYKQNVIRQIKATMVKYLEAWHAHGESKSSASLPFLEGSILSGVFVELVDTYVLYACIIIIMLKISITLKW